MASTAEYYSGYGANRNDVGSERLLAIHKGIQESFGEDAAKSFVKMVKGLRSLAATTFLLALYELDARGYVYNASPTPSNIHVDRNPERGQIADGFVLMAGLMTSQRSDPQADLRETRIMRNDFLRALGEKIQMDPDEINEYRREMELSNWRHEAQLASLGYDINGRPLRRWW